jgi:predicted SAM-dependent methyltransferase
MRLLNLGCGSRYHPAWVNLDYRSTGPGVIAHDLASGIPYADDSFEAVYHSHLLEHFSRATGEAFFKECFRVLSPSGILRVVVPDLEQIARLYLELLEQALEGDREAEVSYDWIILEMLDQMVREEPGGQMLEYWKQDPMPAESFVIERVGSEALNALATLRRAATAQPKKPSAKHPPREEERDARRKGDPVLSRELHRWMYDRYSLDRLLTRTGFHDIRVCRADESRIPGFNDCLLDIEKDGSVRKPDSLFMEGQK